MKVRSDFVTNSSSASMVAISIRSPLLAAMLADYTDALCRRGDLWDAEKVSAEVPEFLDTDIQVGDGCVSFENDEDERGFERMPETLGDVVDCFAEGLKITCEAWSEYDLPVQPLVDVLHDHRMEIEADIEAVSWHFEHQGWGGDSEARFHLWGYPEESWQRLWEQVAGWKGCSVDELTDEDVSDYVARGWSNEIQIFTYDASEKGPNGHYMRDFEISL